SYLVLRNAKNNKHKLMGLFNVAVGLWGLFTSLAGFSHDLESIKLYWRIAYFFGLYAIILFYHFNYAFCEVRNFVFLNSVYILGGVLMILTIFTNLLVDDLFIFDKTLYYHKATILFTCLFMFLLVNVGTSFVYLFYWIKKSSGFYKQQAIYLFC